MPRTQYSRNNLQRKLAKAQRNLPGTTNPKERQYLTRKAKKYLNLLSNMNRGPTPTPTTNINNELEEAIVTYYSKPLLSDETVTPVRHTSFETIFKNPVAAGYKIVKTVGDGDCLIHAFLTSVSPSYRRIPMEDRTDVGGAIRRDFLAPRITDDTETREFFEGDEYLEDQHILTLGTLFHINFIVFQEVPKRHKRLNLPANAVNNINYLEIGTGWPWVMVHNKLGTTQGADHYSAIRDPAHRFVLEAYEEGLAVAKQLAGQEDVARQCPFATGDTVVYNGDAYTVEERRFDGDPPQCVAITLKDMTSGVLRKDIPVGDIRGLSGGRRLRPRRLRKSQ